MSFLWNLFQSSQIEKNQAKADLASVKTRTTAADVARLEERIDALSLAAHAMWELLSKNHAYSENDLLTKMEEIDLRDGVKDGKFTADNIKNCPECNHKITKRRSSCYWCGANLASGGPFAA